MTPDQLLQCIEEAPLLNKEQQLKVNMFIDNYMQKMERKIVVELLNLTQSCKSKRKHLYRHPIHNPGGHLGGHAQACMEGHALCPK